MSWSCVFYSYENQFIRLQLLLNNFPPKEKMMFIWSLFQSAKVTAQSEGMSSRNAQLEIENESLRNDLQNARADYTALQVDMNEFRDYYHQLDIEASKMGHRCEVGN